MKKYRRTKNILEVYVPEAEGWYTFATLHEDSMRDADNWLTSNADLERQLAEVQAACDEYENRWIVAQAALDILTDV